MSDDWLFYLQIGCLSLAACGCLEILYLRFKLDRHYKKMLADIDAQIARRTGQP